MGYTHYWRQTRDFTKEEWSQVCEDIATLLHHVQKDRRTPLADGEGKRRTKPVIDADKILFNGVGDNRHETFCLYRVPPKEPWESERGRDFCKTSRKPYDLAVTAALCYLATVTETHQVSSDGHGSDWLDGLDEARQALPRYANILDIPMPILESDRWCMPWINDGHSGFDVNFCVDGKGYIHKQKTGEWYCFPSHLALAQFLDSTKVARFSRRCRVQFGYRTFDEGNIEPNIWKATGLFNKERHARIDRAQRKVLEPLFPVDPEHAHNPPAYVRPGHMPEPETRHYYFTELLAADQAA